MEEEASRIKADALVGETECSYQNDRKGKIQGRERQENEEETLP